MITVGAVVHLVDVVTGSAATLSPVDGGWQVREGGPVKLWERIEHVPDAYDAADRPTPETFTLHVYGGGSTAAPADARPAAAEALTRAVRSMRPDGESDGPRPGAFYQVRPPRRGGSRISAPGGQQRLYRPARYRVRG